MTLWRQCCYYLHCVNKEMEEWEIKVELPPKKKKRVRLWTSVCFAPWPTRSSRSMEFKGNRNIAVTSVSTMPLALLVSGGSPWQLIQLENPSRIFSLLYHSRHPSFSHFLPLIQLKFTSLPVPSPHNSQSNFPNVNWDGSSPARNRHVFVITFRIKMNNTLPTTSQVILNSPGSPASFPVFLLLDLLLRASREEGAAFLKAFPRTPPRALRRPPRLSLEHRLPLSITLTPGQFLLILWIFP